MRFQITDFFSGFVHGYPWALQQGAFQSILEEENLFLEQQITDDNIRNLCVLAARYIGYAIHSKQKLYGWNEPFSSAFIENK